MTRHRAVPVTAHLALHRLSGSPALTHKPLLSPTPPTLQPSQLPQLCWPLLEALKGSAAHPPFSGPEAPPLFSGLNPRP